MFKKLFIAPLMSLCFLASMASYTYAETQPATIILKPESKAPTINRNIYGQFSEHLGDGIYGGVWVRPNSSIPNVRGIRSDVVAALKELKVPVIRWPGGCFADEYNWRDGIGPREQRPKRKNNWWGGEPESNEFGSHEFMDFVEQIGSSAYISVNLGSSTPTEMREYMEYMTSDGTDTLAQERRKNGRDAPYPIALWGIGNESWGCGGNMRAEYYADEYRRFREFFHKGGTNNGLAIATGPSGDYYGWTEVLMKNAGEKMDGLSLHYYTIPTGDWGLKGQALGFDENQWVKTMSQTLKIDDYITKHVEIMDKYDPKKRVGLYVDEWGSWYDPDQKTNPRPLYQQNTLRDAMIAAVNLNIFHKHAERVHMTAIAQTINVLQAMILTKNDKMALTPTYYVYRMYRPFQGAKLIPLDITAPAFVKDGLSIPSLSATAAIGKDDKLYIGLANLSTQNMLDLSVNLSSINAKSVYGEILSHEKLDAHNVPGEPVMIAPAPFDHLSLKGGTLKVKIPAHSIIVIRLD